MSLGYKTSNAFSMEGKIEFSRRGIGRGRPAGAKNKEKGDSRYVARTIEDRAAVEQHGLMLKQQVKDGQRCEDCYAMIPPSMIGRFANGKTCFECLVRAEIFRSIKSEKLNPKYKGFFEEDTFKLASYLMEGGIERLEKIRSLSREEVLELLYSSK